MVSLLRTLGIAFVVHGIYLIYPLILIVLPIYSLTTAYWWVTCLVVPAYLYWTFDGSEYREGRSWKAFTEFPVWTWIFDYFPVTLERASKPLDPKHKYIFALGPHGTLAWGRLAFAFKRSQMWDKLFPGIETRDLAAGVMFKLPGIREIWLWTKCVDASRATADHLLADSPYSVLVYPGGEYEQIETCKGKQQLVMSHSKGFCRLALRHGAHLVPCYVFGETEIFRCWTGAMSLRRWIVKTFRIAPIVFWGRFFGVPFQVPVTSVTGPPIPVKKVENPTPEQVDLLHARFLEAIRELYEKEKTKHGLAADEPLTIL